MKNKFFFYFFIYLLQSARENKTHTHKTSNNIRNGHNKGWLDVRENKTKRHSFDKKNLHNVVSQQLFYNITSFGSLVSFSICVIIYHTCTAAAGWLFLVCDGRFVRHSSTTRFFTRLIYSPSRICISAITLLSAYFNNFYQRVFKQDMVFIKLSAQQSKNKKSWLVAIHGQQAFARIKRFSFKKGKYTTRRRTIFI